MILSDTHLVLLSAAAQHQHRLLARPDKLPAKAAGKLASRLTAAGLTEELIVKRDQPHWSVNVAGDVIGLHITAAGLEAIGLAEESTAAPLRPEEPPEAGAMTGDATPLAEQTPAPLPRRPLPLRPGSKKALLVELLRQDQGASIETLMAATGWLPHTVRAALTGLRQTGYSLGKTRNQRGLTHYHLTEPGHEVGAADADRAA